MYIHNGTYRLDDTEKANVRHAVTTYMANEDEPMNACLKKAFEGEPFHPTLVDHALHIVFVIEDLIESELNEEFDEIYDGYMHERGE